MRVLGRIRLSRLTEESTSAARQREIIEQWAASNNHDVIGWAEDLDVSGSVDPFNTPELGRWLEPDQADRWDVLCSWKLDRLGRDSIRLNKLFGWAIENGKSVVSCTEGIDLSTPVGRLIANVIAFLAEGELEAIRERTRSSRKKLLESGRWAGGKPQFGYRAVKIPGGGWRLEPHPEEAPILKRIVNEIIAGKTVMGVAEVYGMPPSTLWQILESKQLLGHATYEGRTVRDLNGDPVLNGEPLLSVDEWGRLQDALQNRRQGPKRTKDTSPLLGVVKCYECEQNLLHKVYHRDYGKRLYRYYHCRDGHCAQVDAETVENLLECAFLEAVGDHPVMERVYRSGDSPQTALDEAVRAVDELSALLATSTSDTVRQRLTEQLRALDARIVELEKQPSREAGWEFTETGLTYRETWLSSNQDQKRQLLLKSGITYRIMRIAGTQAVKSQLYIPDEILDRLNSKKPLPS